MVACKDGWLDASKDKVCATVRSEQTRADLCCSTERAFLAQ